MCSLDQTAAGESPADRSAHRTAGRRNRPLVFGRGENPINFVAVRDVAALLERVVIEPATRGHTFEIGSPDNLTLDELAGMVAANLGGTGNPRHVPRAALHVMAATAGRLNSGLGRQARAALVMDRHDMTFLSDRTRAEFAGLPCTPAAKSCRPAYQPGPTTPGNGKRPPEPDSPKPSPETPAHEAI